VHQPNHKPGQAQYLTSFGHLVFVKRPAVIANIATRQTLVKSWSNAGQTLVKPAFIANTATRQSPLMLTSLIQPSPTTPSLTWQSSLIWHRYDRHQ
jgi:hypothetical protein